MKTIVTVEDVQKYEFIGDGGLVISAIDNVNLPVDGCYLKPDAVEVFEEAKKAVMTEILDTTRENWDENDFSEFEWSQEASEYLFSQVVDCIENGSEWDELPEEFDECNN